MKNAATRISRSEWLWLLILWLLKSVADIVFFKFQASELTFDNIDYLDHAKQYFYSADISVFYHTFLHSFGRLRSPFESLLIFIVKLAIPKLSFGAIAYVLQTISLLALAAACLSVAKRTAKLLDLPWYTTSSAILLATIFFAPLSIGLSRGTLVELMLVACMQIVVVVCCRLASHPTATNLCYLNMVLAWGLLTKFTFPLYIFLPVLVLCASALLRLQVSALLFSLLFQILVQVSFCYNIVNLRPMLQNARIQDSLTSYGYLVPIGQEITVNGFGLPLTALLATLILYFCIIALRPASIVYSSIRSLLTRPIAALRVGGAPVESLVLSAAFINFVLLLGVHLHATNHMVRFFYFFVPVAAAAAALMFSKARIGHTVRMAITIGFVVSNVGTCLLFSIPTTNTVCSHPVLSKVFNISCKSADPVDGTMYAPRTANYHVFELIRLLQQHIPAGSKVVMVNPNEYFDNQTVAYHLRDTIAQRGFYFNITLVGVTELRQNSPALWQGAKAVIFKDFTTTQYDVFVANGAPPLQLSQDEAAKYNRIVSENLKRIGAVRIFRETNSDGIVAVYLVK